MLEIFKKLLPEYSCDPALVKDYMSVIEDKLIECGHDPKEETTEFWDENERWLLVLVKGFASWSGYVFEKSAKEDYAFVCHFGVSENADKLVVMYKLREVNDFVRDFVRKTQNA